jgi:predicted Rdx family selenoprotein
MGLTLGRKKLTQTTPTALSSRLNVPKKFPVDADKCGIVSSVYYLRRCVMTNEELMTLIEEIARVALEDQVCSRYIEHELGATTWDLDKAYAYLEAKLNKENKDETN